MSEFGDGAGFSEKLKITHTKGDTGEVIIQELEGSQPRNQQEDNLKKILYLINKIKEDQERDGRTI
jgi:hypothetical protein